MSDIFTKYDTSAEGLTQSEVQKRQEKYGLNRIEEEKPTPLIILFLSQFADILIALLIIAAIASFLIGDVIDAGVIMLAVLLNTIIGFIQEYRSRRAVESLKGLITKTAVVKRDCEITEIDAESLTIGDIVILGETYAVKLLLISSGVCNARFVASYVIGGSLRNIYPFCIGSA